MLTFEDCLGLCELTEDEVEAIAEHEHVPEIVALELAQYLAETAEGERVLRRFIIEDMEAARSHGDTDRLARLEVALKHFVITHPRCCRP